jgi:hypothetical protein
MKARDHSEDLGVAERIILKWILRKWGVLVWIGFIWLKIRTCEHGNEPSGSIKSGNFSDYLGDHYLVMNDYVCSCISEFWNSQIKDVKVSQNIWINPWNLSATSFRAGGSHILAWRKQPSNSERPGWNTRQSLASQCQLVAWKRWLWTTAGSLVGRLGPVVRNFTRVATQTQIFVYKLNLLSLLLMMLWMCC